MVPNTGPYDGLVNTEAVSALFNKIGSGILVTHSQSGGLGWLTALKNKNIRAIVSYEPGRRLSFSGGRTADTHEPRRQRGQTAQRAFVGFCAAHKNSDHHLLRRQYSR
jgi:hypothetical protein